MFYMKFDKIDGIVEDDLSVWRGENEYRWMFKLKRFDKLKVKYLSCHKIIYFIRDCLKKRGNNDFV